MEIIIDHCSKQLPLELSDLDIEKLKEDEAGTLPVVCRRTGGLITLRVEITNNRVKLICTRLGVCGYYKAD